MLRMRFYLTRLQLNWGVGQTHASRPLMLAVRYVFEHSLRGDRGPWRPAASYQLTLAVA